MRTHDPRRSRPWGRSRLTLSHICRSSGNPPPPTSSRPPNHRSPLSHPPQQPAADDTRPSRALHRTTGAALPRPTAAAGGVDRDCPSASPSPSTSGGRTSRSSSPRPYGARRWRGSGHLLLLATWRLAVPTPGAPWSPAASFGPRRRRRS